MIEKKEEIAAKRLGQPFLRSIFKIPSGPGEEILGRDLMASYTSSIVRGNVKILLGNRMFCDKDIYHHDLTQC